VKKDYAAVMRARFMTGLLALTLIGCGGDDDDGGSGSTAIAEGKLSGKVGGEPWTVASAETDAFFSNDKKLWVELYGEPSTEACGLVSPSGNHLLLNVPTSPGEYPLSLDLNGTFVIETPTGTDNLVGTKGLLRVDEVSATTLRAGINIEYDAGSSVSGEFEAVICAE
jgi:hypothetical protein